MAFSRIISAKFSSSTHYFKGKMIFNKKENNKKLTILLSYKKIVAAYLRVGKRNSTRKKVFKN